MNILSFSTINAETYCKGMCGCSGLVGYLMTYQLPKDVTVTPSLSKQTVMASAKNRYIRSVIVEPVSKTLSVTPSSSAQTFTDGPYSTVTVAAAEAQDRIAKFRHAYLKEKEQQHEDQTNI